MGVAIFYKLLKIKTVDTKLQNSIAEQRNCRQAVLVIDATDLVLGRLASDCSYPPR